MIADHEKEPVYDDGNHQKDSDCTVNPDTDLCEVCGVDHSDICIECGGRGFHVEGCSEVTGSEWTIHEATCRECGDRFKIGRTAILLCQEECGSTYREAVEAMEWCLGCVSGTSPEGEKEPIDA